MLHGQFLARRTRDETLRPSTLRFTMRPPVKHIILIPHRRRDGIDSVAKVAYFRSNFYQVFCMRNSLFVFC